MVSEADNGAVEDVPAATGADDESNAMVEPGRSLGVMTSLFWGLGRAVRGVAVGTAWVGDATGSAITSALAGIGGGARARAPDTDEPEAEGQEEVTAGDGESAEDGHEE